MSQSFSSDKVIRISRVEAKDFCAIHHYSGTRFPTAAQHFFGMYDGDKLVGVCVFGQPASPWVSISIVGEKNKVIELQRLALSRNIKNEGTWFLSKVWKLLAEDFKGIVVSYADTAQGHHGGVYQAFGFNYAGCSSRRTDIYTEGHPRHHDGDATKRKERSAKHRYWLSCPRAKYDCTVTDKWLPLPYQKPNIQ
jgi:hypothetical protein